LDPHPLLYIRWIPPTIIIRWFTHQAYVPQITYRGLETPLLACDISVFDHEYIDWTGKYADYDIFAEAKTELQELFPEKVDRMSGALFSICKVYPTKVNPVSEYGVV
jgi:hypothetical protein